MKADPKTKADQEKEAKVEPLEEEVKADPKERKEVVAKEAKHQEGTKIEIIMKKEEEKTDTDDSKVTEMIVAEVKLAVLI